MNIHSLFNVALLVYLVSFPILIEVNKRYLKGKNAGFNQGLKMGRKIHPIAGLILIVSGAIHGYIKLGGQLQFHTGSLVILALVAAGTFGFLYKKTKKRPLAYVHRIAGFSVVLLFALHYFFPWALLRL